MITDEWEKKQEKNLEFEERMKNWWMVELRDAAAANLRGYSVQNYDELKYLAKNILCRLGYDPKKINLNKAASILSVYVIIDEDEINESLGDILKPKSREEVIKELNKLSLGQKLEAIDSYYYDKGELLNDLNMAGTDERKIIEISLINASNKELIEIINELIDYESEPIELLMGCIDDKKHENIFQRYITNENKTELNDIVNSLLMKHTDIIREIDIDTDEYSW